MMPRDMQSDPLRHPPVVEAIASFRLVSSLRDVESWPDAPLGRAFRSPTPLHDQKGRQIGVQFAPAEGESQMVRFLDSGFFFHLLSPYPGFETFSRQLGAAFNAYVSWIERRTQAQFRQIGLRNINLFRLTDLPGAIQWHDLLKDFPKDGDAKSISSFAAEKEQTVACESLGVCEASIASIFVRDKETEAPSVILDISVASPGRLDVNVSEAIELLSALRPIKNTLFWENLSPSLQESLL